MMIIAAQQTMTFSTGLWQKTLSLIAESASFFLSWLLSYYSTTVCGYWRFYIVDGTSDDLNIAVIGILRVLSGFENGFIKMSTSGYLS